MISTILGLAKSHGSNPPPLETSLTPGHDGILGKSASVDHLSTLDKIRTPAISSEEKSRCLAKLTKPIWIPEKRSYRIDVFCSPSKEDPLKNISKQEEGYFSACS